MNSSFKDKVTDRIQAHLSWKVLKQTKVHRRLFKSPGWWNRLLNKRCRDSWVDIWEKR